MGSAVRSQIVRLTEVWSQSLDVRERGPYLGSRRGEVVCYLPVRVFPVPISWTLTLDTVFEEVPLTRDSRTQRGPSNELDDSDFFVFTDGSAVDSGVVQRFSGWLPAGDRSVSFSVRTGKRHSALGRYQHIVYVRGSVNKERLQFLREQIVHLSSSLYP